MKFKTLIIVTTALFMSAPAMGQTEGGTPAFRVPLGGSSTATSGPPVFTWMETVGTCSSSCGDGTRTTSYRCQDVNAYDFSGGGYGAPESDASCSAAGPRPASTSASCTNYSGCSYDWVRPPVDVVRLPKPKTAPETGTYPIGEVDDCSYAKRTFTPFCQRDGSPAVQMAAADHAFCRNDRPDYDGVASGDPDALGYDRTADVKTACVAGPRDYAWKVGAWTPEATVSPYTANCTPARPRTRTVECSLKFNGEAASDARCAGIAKPSTTGTEPADYSSCSYDWDAGSYGSWSSTCSTSATRTRVVTCRRSDGTTVADAQCASSGTKPSTSETGSNLVGCTRAWTTPSAWTYASTCSSNTTRSRTTSCRRSDGVTVPDSECPAGDKPVLFESNVSDFSACTYTPRDMGRSACTGSGTQDQYWDCTRADGTTGYPASFCGKTNPETVSCTPPPSYTYTPVNRGETVCTAGRKDVYWDCTRSDGAAGFPASMCGKSNPENVACTMSYTWNWQVGAWSGYDSGCSSFANRSRSVSCVRSDGVVDGDQNCNAGARPASSEQAAIYSGCGYASEATTSFTACASNSTRTRQLQCRRSDGVIVANSFCGHSGVQTESCTYTPTTGNTCAPDSGGTNMYSIGQFVNAYGRGTTSGSESARSYESCQAAGGTCFQVDKNMALNQENGGDGDNNNVHTCFGGSSRLANGGCNPNITGFCSPEANVIQQTRTPSCQTTRGNLYQYSCTGGTVLGEAKTSWIRRGNDRQETVEGNVSATQNCFNLGGDCLSRAERTFSDYGDPEGGEVRYLCLRNGGRVTQDHTFVSDSFQQEYTEACELR